MNPKSQILSFTRFVAKTYDENETKTQKSYLAVNYNYVNTFYLIYSNLLSIEIISPHLFLIPFTNTSDERMKRILLVVGGCFPRHPLFFISALSLSLPVLGFMFISLSLSLCRYILCAEQPNLFSCIKNTWYNNLILQVLKVISNTFSSFSLWSFFPFL